MRTAARADIVIEIMHTLTPATSIGRPSATGEPAEISAYAPMQAATKPIRRSAEFMRRFAALIDPRRP
ncbi:unannotated protein [freshwater metagenome]|uniref:Unannotated protein n=1 Tax=freshwater metagenome TaxID=449393 RepID=A0A6J7APU2_9ZZZZ